MADKMKACVLFATGPIEASPLHFTEVEIPEPHGDQILVRVAACGVCRTDLHVIEADLARTNCR
jgi:propanol-preferring alcohol dehydrogenase